MYFIFTTDYILLPVYLIALWWFFRWYFKTRHGNDPVLRKHFNRGLALKFIGCIAIGLIYEHYYRGAYDGRVYFDGGKLLYNYLWRHPGEFIHVYFNDLKSFQETNLEGIDLHDVFLFANESFSVSKIVALLNLFSYNSFLPCSLFFASFAFLAIWNLFMFFIEEFKLSPKLAGFCTIYIPSVMVWGSSIFKDTITFSALCWFFICTYYIFIKPRKILRNSLGLIISGFLIIYVKIYILAAAVPFLILLIFNSYKQKIKNPVLKVMLTPIILILIGICITLFLRNADELLGRYSAEKVLETASLTYQNITAYGGYAGSAYSLNVDFSSPAGLLMAIPVGINLTLFRPYPWEYLKPFILLASAESMLYLYFTLVCFFKGGFMTTIRLIRDTPILQFCLLFSFLFAFMTGVSAANFGTLVRYKIPCLPFYALFLAIIYKAKFIDAKKPDVRFQHTPERSS